MKTRVVIIGAGCVGCAVARELSRYKLDIKVLEAKADIASGATKANSAIIHAGYDAAHTTLKGKLSVKGSASFDQLQNELNFPFRRCGSFVAAFDQEGEAKLKMLLQNGEKNGVKALELITGDALRQKEPHASKHITRALYAPSAGIIDPFAYTFALAQNAVANGVKVYTNARVTAIHPHPLGAFTLRTTREDLSALQADFIINAAGVYADEIEAMLGEPTFQITPIKGQYILFDKTQSHKVNSVLFQTPRGKGKGVLVAKSIHGNVFVGPSYEIIRDKEDVSTTKETLQDIFRQGQKVLPGLDMAKAITQFSGLRAASSAKDFIIQHSIYPGLILAAGIESPGLSVSYAIARRIAELLGEKTTLKENPRFDPCVKKRVKIAELSEEEISALIQHNPLYKEIVCRCEEVSLKEIHDAIHTPPACATLDAVKRRTRAGMGRCQGSFCTPRLLEILHQESGLPIESIEKSEAGSYIVYAKAFPKAQDKETSL